MSSSTAASPVAPKTPSASASKSAGGLAAAASAALAEKLKNERLKREQEWKSQTPSTYLSFIRGYDAFPCKTSITTNPSILFDAVKSKDISKAKQLLLSDGDINVVNTSGSTLCHEAVRTGDVAMLEMILSFHPGKLTVTAVFHVRIKNDLHPADIDRKEHPSVGGSAPLHAAAAQGNLDMIKLLLLHRADPTSRDSAVESTPLHVAARHGHKAICEALIEAG